MKKWMKITASGLTVILLAIVAVFVYSVPTGAKEAQVTMHTPEKVKNGETFTVTIAVDSPSALAGIDARITYDPELVAFVGDQDGIMTGSDGIVNLKEDYQEETTERFYQLVFQALAVGEVQFCFDKTYITDYAGLEELEIHSNQGTVQVLENAGISDDADLKELLVATGTLSPAFSPEITQYSVDVEQDEDTFIFSSVASDEEANVAVDMPEILKTGDNVVTITVTAPSGAVKEYVIHVNRMKE